MELAAIPSWIIQVFVTLEQSPINEQAKIVILLGTYKRLSHMQSNTFDSELPKGVYFLVNSPAFFF